MFLVSPDNTNMFSLSKYVNEYNIIVEEIFFKEMLRRT